MGGQRTSLGMRRPQRERGLSHRVDRARFRTRANRCPGTICGAAAAQPLRCKVTVSVLCRFSFCNSCRSLHFRRSPTASRDVSLRADPHLRQSEIDLASRERAGTPIAKLFSTTTLTAPFGASREKNEGRGCQAEGEPWVRDSIVIGRQLVRRSLLIIHEAFHSHPETLADIKRPAVQTVARWPVTYG